MEEEELRGEAAPREFGPRNNFGAGGLGRTLVEIDREYSDDGVVWQEEVYQFAQAVYVRQNALRVVDFGTGTGIKLEHAFEPICSQRIQVDWDDRRKNDKSRGLEAAGEFIAANLEDYGDLEAVFARLRDATPSVFILSDTIEHLQDVRPILRLLRRLLRQHLDNRLIISTPDRFRIDGQGASGLPDNPSHVRQWTLTEFGLSLRSAGFELASIGRVNQNKFDDSKRTIVAELLCSDESYTTFLEKHRLPRRGDHIVITTEHGHALRTGGIGSYYRYADENLERSPVYLFTGSHGLPADWLAFVRRKGWVHVKELSGPRVPPPSLPTFDTPDDILEAFLSVMFLYDEVALVEYQDYVGIGARVAQAKRARLVPPSITVCAYAHGNMFYLDNASGRLGSTGRSLDVDLAERVSLEQADVVLFPSTFLRNLYSNELGLQFRRTIQQGYPIELKHPALPDVKRGKVDTLLFYGKDSVGKGYPEFCDAVLSLFCEPGNQEVALQIKRIVLMGVKAPDPRLEALPGLEVIWGVYGLDEALDILSANAPRALAVLPYKADNHPLSLFEVVEARCQLIAFATGGIPEIIPEVLHSRMLCAPSAMSLAALIRTSIDMPFWDRSRLIDEVWWLMKERYDLIRADYQATLGKLKCMKPSADVQRSSVSVIVPNLNGETHFFEDLAQGVRNSFLRPEKVVFVDDGSDLSGQERLAAGAALLGSIPHEIIRNDENLGLASARNVGLQRVTTAYVCAHDNDNILLNRYLDLASRILDENPDVAVVTSWHWGFQDGKSWRYQRRDWDLEYRPAGQDLGAGLRTNTFGDAMAVYRTDTLKSVGGWDGSSKALWEDWQLFLRLTARGFKIWVIPAEMFLYRLRPTSMLQTYRQLPGEMRLARTIPGLGAADGVSLIRALRYSETAGSPQLEAQVQWRDQKISELLARLQQARQASMVAMAQRARAYVDREEQQARERERAKLD